VAQIAALACTFLLLGCEPVKPLPNRRGDVGGRSFEMSSGGAYAEDGRGEWILRLRGDALWIARARGEDLEELGTHRLTGAESKKLWRLIDEAALPSRKETRRRADPETIRWRFTYTPVGELPRTIELLDAEVERDDSLDTLVRYGAKLIRKYTGKKPRF
jgi:hypothetical protein